jgi:hypothetical protein
MRYRKGKSPVVELLHSQKYTTGFRKSRAVGNASCFRFITIEPKRGEIIVE